MKLGAKGGAHNAPSRGGTPGPHPRSRAASSEPPGGQRSQINGSETSGQHENKPRKKPKKKQTKSHVAAPQAHRIDFQHPFAPVQLPLPCLNKNRVKQMMDAYANYYVVKDQDTKIENTMMYAYCKWRIDGHTPTTIVAQRIISEKNTYFKPETQTYGERTFYKLLQSEESTFLLYVGLTASDSDEEKAAMTHLFTSPIDVLKPIFARDQIQKEAGEEEMAKNEAVNYKPAKVDCLLYCCMPLTARDGDKNTSVFISILVPCVVPALPSGAMNLTDANMLGIVQSEALGKSDIASSRNAFLSKYAKYILSTNWDHVSTVSEADIRKVDEAFASIFDSMYMVKRIDKSLGCVNVIQHTYKVGERLGRLPGEDYPPYTMTTQFVLPTNGLQPESKKVMLSTLSNMLDYMRVLVRNPRYRKAIVAMEEDNAKQAADASKPQLERTKLAGLFQKAALADFGLVLNETVVKYPHWNIAKSTHYLQALYAVHSVSCFTQIMSKTIDKKRYGELNDTKVTWREFFEENGVYANRRIEMETRTTTENPLARVPLRDEFENDDTTDEEDKHPTGRRSQ